MAVFNEGTGKMMEKKDLIRHPDPVVCKRWERAVSNKFGRLLKEIERQKVKVELATDMIPSTLSKKTKYQKKPK